MLAAQAGADALIVQGVGGRRAPGLLRGHRRARRDRTPATATAGRAPQRAAADRLRRHRRWRRPRRCAGRRRTRSPDRHRVHALPRSGHQRGASGCPEPSGSTALTRAFSGRRARGIVNAFMRNHDDRAPAAYPHVNQLTAPLRAAARRAGDTDAHQPLGRPGARARRGSPSRRARPSVERRGAQRPRTSSRRAHGAAVAPPNDASPARPRRLSRQSGLAERVGGR